MNCIIPLILGLQGLISQKLPTRFASSHHLGPPARSGKGQWAERVTPAPFQVSFQQPSKLCSQPAPLRVSYHAQQLPLQLPKMPGMQARSSGFPLLLADLLVVIILIVFPTAAQNFWCANADYNHIILAKISVCIQCNMTFL